MEIQIFRSDSDTDTYDTYYTLKGSFTLTDSNVVTDIKPNPIDLHYTYRPFDLSHSESLLVPVSESIIMNKP